MAQQVYGGGDCGDLIRDFDWSKTAFGSLGSWSAELLNTVNVMLHSPLACVLLLGDEGYLLYNNGYAVFAGDKHPEIMGTLVAVAWPEIADFNRDIIRRVHAGETISLKEQKLMLQRADYPEEVYLDLSYGPIMDKEGVIFGVQVWVLETTDGVMSRREEQIAREALAMERSQLQSLFNSAPAAIALMRGSEYRYDFANSRYLSIVGKKNIIGKTMHDALPELASQGIYDMLNKVYATGEPYTGIEIPITINRGKGNTPQQGYYNFTYQAYYDESQEIDGVLVYANDVTQQVEARQRQENLRRITLERNELKKLNRSKDEFIGMVSHQLRTPATAVKQYVSLLTSGFSGALSDDQKLYAERAYYSNERQLGIINDMLKIAQIDANRYVLRQKQTSIADIVERATSEVEHSIQSRKQKLHIRNKLPNVDLYIDPSEINLVLINILENASKYSPENTTISFDITGKNQRVSFSISDQGVGIAKEDIKQMFQKFTRLDNQYSDTVSGSGLGLYLANQIVKLHAGRIKVVSEAGKGSTFTVSLPYE